MTFQFILPQEQRIFNKDYDLRNDLLGAVDENSILSEDTKADILAPPVSVSQTSASHAVIELFFVQYQ